jgi:hypothetical protein
VALHTLGTKGASQLSCLPAWSQVLASADVGAISASIVGDGNFGAVLGGFSAGTTAVLATATTAASNSLTSVTARGGSPPITQIHVGDLVLGTAADIVPGTFVQAISGTTVTLSQAALSSGASKAVAFLRLAPREGVDKFSQLFVPRRGVLRVLPGDFVAIDATGWPILVSGNAVGYAGSDWTFT